MSARENPVLRGMAAQARQAAEQKREVDAAFAEQRAAAERLMRAVLDAASPAADALASPVPGFPHLRGAALAERGPGAVEGASSRVLYLMAAPGAPLAEVTFAMRDRGSYFAGEGVAYAEVDAAWASVHYDVDRVATRLFNLLARQLDGASGRRAEQARCRAEYLRALARVVEECHVFGGYAGKPQRDVP